MKSSMGRSVHDNSIVLCGCLHIGAGDLNWIVSEASDVLKQLGVHLVCSATQQTDATLISKLEAIGIEMHIQPKESNAYIGYTQALRAALDKQDITHVLYIDFDRLLHWAKYYRKELETLVEHCKANTFEKDVYVLERTSRAYATHHDSLIKTEEIANTVLSRQLGFDDIHDYLSGSWYCKRDVATLWMSDDAAFPYTPAMLYSAWLILAQKAGYRIDFLQFEGLEWETSDPFQSDVQKIGVDAFRDSFSTADEWKRRVTYLKEIIDGCFVQSS
jgi:hypothetical protein